MVEVILPYGGSCPHRQAALDWVRGRYQWPVTIATAPPGPWCKAAAVMPAVERSTADVLVVADADVFSDGVGEAIHAVSGGAAWAIPHLNVCRLTPDATTALLAGEESAASYDEKPYRGIEGGGIIVARRETLLEIPLDPRFIGWGQEDESHGVALHTLAGEPWRGTHDLIHLWHPPQPRASRARGSHEGWRLRRRYLKARRDPAQMRELLEEAHASLAAPQHAGHDHPTQPVG